MNSFPNEPAGMPDVVNGGSLEIFGSELSACATVFGENTYPTANLAIFVPLHVHSAIVVKALIVRNGGSVSGNLDIGIYRKDLTLVISTGSTAQAGISAYQSITVTNTRITPGFYWIGIALDNTTARVSRCNQILKELAYCLGIREMSTAFPLPSTAIFSASNAATYVPEVGLRTTNYI